MNYQVPPFRVGVDVLDRRDPSLGVAHRERFLRRVLSPDERRRLRAAADPELELWLRWAGKEAAFKVVAGAPGGAPVFAHARFEVSFDGPDGPAPPTGPRGFTVRCPGGPVPGRVSWTEERIVAVAWEEAAAPTEEAPPPALASGHARLRGGEAAAPGEGGGERTGPEEGGGDGSGPEAGGDVPPRRGPEAYRARFSEREWAGIHSEASAVVRLRAREAAARLLGVPEERVEIVTRGEAVGRSPPVLLLDGEPAPATVSLSHHGRFVAWALLPRRGDGASGGFGR